MIDQQKIENEMSTLDDIRGLVVAYETIASSAMRRIRHSVLTNREFHSGLDRLFREVMTAYRKEVERLMKKYSKRRFLERFSHSQPKKSALSKKNGKTVRVLLSANTGLYGDIIDKTCTRFFKEAREYPGDVVVIGKTGRAYWKNAHISVPHRYFDFPDDRVPLPDLKKIIAYVGQYERVVVFHGAFRSLVAQDAAATDVSGTIAGVREEDRRIVYLFEPSLETVAIFFETQIFASLLEQLFHESRLAKAASRMVLLDGATAQVDRTLKNLVHERRKIRHRVFNRKQLNSLAGVMLWESAI